MLHACKAMSTTSKLIYGSNSFNRYTSGFERSSFQRCCCLFYTCGCFKEDHKHDKHNNMLIAKWLPLHMSHRHQDLFAEKSLGQDCLLSAGECLMLPVAGFAQWKAILHLMLGCQEGPLESRVPFFTQFLQALYNQLQHSLAQVSLLPACTCTEALHLYSFEQCVFGLQS